MESSDEGTSGKLSQESIGIYSNLSLQNLNSAFSNVDPTEGGPPAPKKLRAIVNVINEKVVAVLDQCQLSGRRAVHLIIAIAQSLGHDVNTLEVNRTSIRYYRERLREIKAKNILNNCSKISR